MTAPHYDPFSKAAIEDPYPMYRRLRDQVPVYHNPERGFWAVSRYEDVVAVSRDWATYTTRMGVDIDNAGDVLGGGFFLAQDPPAHDKLRAVIRGAFGPRTIRERYAPEVQREVDDLMAGLARAATSDVAGELCWKLPTRVMAALLGFPHADCDRLTALGLAFAQREIGNTVPPATSNEAGMGLMMYFQEQIALRRKQPRDDLLTVIATASVDGVPLGDSAEGMALLVFVGGFENVGCALTNAIYLLARHPQQRAWLADHREAIPAAVEEILRFDAPQQNFKRTTTRDLELMGVHIPAGKPVFLLYGSANRDERQFTQPEAFDVRAERARHMSFGEGIHFCLGSALARLQAICVIERLLQDYPHYDLLEGARRLPNHAVRGFTHLPCQLRSAEISRQAG